MLKFRLERKYDIRSLLTLNFSEKISKRPHLVSVSSIASLLSVVIDTKICDSIEFSVKNMPDITDLHTHKTTVEDIQTPNNLVRIRIEKFGFIIFSTNDIFCFYL